MKMQFYRIAVLLLGLFLHLNEVESIKCFQCNSENPGCNTLMANDTESIYLKECGSNRTFCRKTVHKIIDSNMLLRITRSCGWELHKGATANCYENDDDFKFERSCQCFEDACNSSQITNGLPLLVFLCVITFLYRNH